MNKLVVMMLGLCLCGVNHCLLATPQSLIANKQANKQTDKQALRQLVTNFNHFAANFTQKVEDNTGQLVMSGKGKVYMAQPRLFRWHAETPDEHLMVSDGQTLWIHNIDLEQVTILTAQTAIDTTPLALLTSPDDSLWQRYSVVKKGQVYQIKPLEQQGQIREVNLRFEAQQLQQLTMLDASGQQSTFVFEPLQSNAQLAATLFIFTPPDGVDIDDQRAAQ